MPNPRYAKGTRAEKKSRKWLEERGYFVVEARGSHGACDLVALGADGDRVVQVKSGRKVTPAERAEIRAAMGKIPYKADRFFELHWWGDYSREPVIEALL